MTRPARQGDLFPPDDPPAPAAAPTTAAPARETPHAADGSLDLHGQQVYVVDAHSLIFQVFHAMPEMSSPTGRPTGAVHGFTRDLLDLLERKQPDYLFCAFDLPGPTFRHELYEAYKIQREEMPLDLRLQIETIREVLAALAIPVVEQPGFEADDVLATFARLVDAAGGQCRIVTGDKDCRQLITPRVSLYNIRKDQMFGADDLAADWGVRPDQVVDFQALVGDSVDNVPGVPGIGPKGARELLEKYGSLEGVLAHAGEIKGKRGENLRQFAEQARLSQRLVRLDDRVPVAIDWSAGRVGGIDRERIRELFTELGFQRLTDRAAGLKQADAPAHWRAQYRLVDSLDELRRLVDELATHTQLSFDTETTSTNPRWAELVGVSLAWRPGEAYYVPVRAPAGDTQLPLEGVLAALRPVLENPAIAKVGQNLKYDMVVMRGVGIELAGAAFDTMIADYLLDAGRQSHNLDDLAKRYLNHTTIKIGELIGTGKNQQRMDEAPVAQVAQYAAEDADVPLRLVGILGPQLDAHGLRPLFDELEMPLIEVLVELEYNGVKVDVARLAELSGQYAARMETLEREIHEQAGRRFNIASPKQLAELLFQELKLPVVKRTKTGPSTDAEVLEELARVHPLPAKIVEYRQYAKLRGTYVDALPQLVHPGTGRIHTSFNQVVAATGRLSSNEPNLQNIPIRTEVGREIRSAFLPGEPGWRLLAADYSQIELRVLAHFSGDAALCEAFARDEDIHTRVASEVFGVPLAEVTSEMRRRAKAVNFGVIYGQSAFGLAKSLGIDKEVAADFIDAYFRQYPGVAAFMLETLAQCRQNGYVTTILGRRRAIEGVRDTAQLATSYQRNLPERTAINTVIQGSAADLIKQAMLRVYRRMRSERHRGRMLLQIHDELVFETPADALDGLARLVDEEMTAAGQLRTPLRVDLQAGANWAECDTYDLV